MVKKIDKEIDRRKPLDLWDHLRESPDEGKIFTSRQIRMAKGVPQ